MSKENSIVSPQDIYLNEGKKQAIGHIQKRYQYGLLSVVLFVICIQFFFCVTKTFNQSVDKKLAKWSGSALSGMVHKVGVLRESAKLKFFFSGVFQRHFEAWFNNAVPFKPLIVKAHNQFYFYAFAKSSTGSVVIGKKGYLFGLPYNEKYYNTPRKEFTQKSFDAWANDLQALANFFTRRGQHFIYFITPSKSAYYPEYLPDCRRCNQNETRPDYHLVTDTLKKRGFKFTDASEMTLNLKKEFGDYLFPKGGVHWTDLAAAYAAQALLKEISDKDPKYSMPNFTFTYQLDSIKGARRWSSDADFLNIANLLFPPLDYIVPEIFVTAPKKPKRKLKLAIVGGSFAGQPAKILSKIQFFQQIDLFHYLIVRHDRFTHNNERYGIPLKANKEGETPPQIRRRMRQADVYYPEDYQDLFNADVVILEENEQNLRSNHFKLLLKRTLGKKTQY